MKEITQVKQSLKEKVKELERMKLKVEKSLKKAPEGTLVLSQSNGTTQYYHKTERQQKKGKYISSEERKIAAALAQKDYDLHFLKRVEEQKKRICRAIDILPEDDVMEVYSELSEARKKLVTPHILTDEEYVEQWMSVQYVGKAFAPDTPEIITERGERVRSKTEKMLADKFFAMGIPYRYECPLHMKGYGNVYPDFTLLNIHKREEVYWEHFGMMDNPEYAHKAIQKLESYNANGIYIGKNLLVTFETLRNPLNTRTVEKLLKEFIL